MMTSCRPSRFRRLHFGSRLCALVFALFPAEPLASALSSPLPDGPRVQVLGRLSPASPPRGPGWSVLFQEGFEAGVSAWNVTDLSGVAAQWSDWNCWSFGGSRSAGCAAGGANVIGCGEDYKPEMKTWLIRGPFALDSGLTGARLTFRLNLDAEPHFDGFIAASSADGLNFDGLELDGTVEGMYTLDLAGRIGSPQVWIGFLFFSDGSGHRPNGAMIDDVVVEVQTPPPPSSRYAWTLSSSGVDPWSNRGGPSPGVNILYLWCACAPAGEGISAADLMISASHGSVLSLQMTNGFLNAGTATHPLLAVGGCPTGPVVAGQIQMLDTGTGLEVCLLDPNGQPGAVSVDCNPFPEVHESDVVGYITTNLGWSACSADSACGLPTTAIETMSWGAIRALYR